MTALKPWQAFGLEACQKRGFIEVTRAQQQEILHQIGARNIMAISGGRVTTIPCGVLLPVGRGYSVSVMLNGKDLYSVTRWFKRGDYIDKGTMEDITCDDVAEVAYYASCFVNVAFPLVFEGEGRAV